MSTEGRSGAAAAAGVPDWAQTPEGFARFAAEDRSGSLIAATITLTVVATLVVILRLWCRRLARLPFWWDDFVIVIALILAYGATVLGTLTTAYGMGHHVVTVIKTYPQLAKAQYGSAITYPMQLAATKVAILLMYRRIFPVSSFRHGLRKMGFYSVAWYIILFLVVGYGISFTFSIIFTCLPIYSLWTIPLPANTKCNHQSAQWLSIALNITNDLLILSLPIGKILGLKLKKSQKVVLSGIFMLGGFVLFASIVRLYYITKAINLKDPTWEAPITIIWTLLEIFVGIICACLPVMRPLVSLCLGRKKRGTPSSSRKTSPTSTTTNETGTTDSSVAIAKRQLLDSSSHTGTENRDFYDAEKRGLASRDRDLASSSTLRNDTLTGVTAAPYDLEAQSSQTNAPPRDFATTVTTTPYPGGTTITTVTHLPFESYVSPYTGSVDFSQPTSKTGSTVATPATTAIAYPSPAQMRTSGASSAYSTRARALSESRTGPPGMGVESVFGPGGVIEDNGSSGYGGQSGVPMPRPSAGQAQRMNRQGGGGAPIEHIRSQSIGKAVTGSNSAGREAREHRDGREGQGVKGGEQGQAQGPGVKRGYSVGSATSVRMSQGQHRLIEMRGRMDEEVGARYGEVV